MFDKYSINVILYDKSSPILKKLQTTTHPWCYSHFTNINAYRMWGVKVKVQVFKGELHTYIHLHQGASHTHIQGFKKVTFYDTDWQAKNYQYWGLKVTLRSLFSFILPLLGAGKKYIDSICWKSLLRITLSLISGLIERIFH